VPDSLLNVGNELAGVGLIPPAIEFFSHDSELDDQVARQIPWLGFAALFPP
jgi:hypothetical protein